MANTPPRPSRAAFWLLGLSLLLGSATSAADERVLERVLFEPVGEATAVVVELSQPMSYAGHFPQHEGKLLELKLLPRPGAMPNTVDEDTLPGPAQGPVPLIDVRYQRVAPSVANVTLRFAKTVSFRVAQGTDPRRLTVIVDTAADAQSSPTAGDISPAAANLLPPRYAIVLSSARQPPTAAAIQTVPLADTYKVYVSSLPINGTTWYRLRMGFFYTPKEAERALAQLRPQYPGAWVALVSDAEREEAATWALNTGVDFSPGQAQAPKEPAPVALQDKTAMLMEEARQAMIAGDYPKAIQYYTRVLDSADLNAHPDALEYLGVARDRNGQFAHAKAEYEKYLRLYPDGPGATRVKQRLTGLLTAEAPEKQKLAGAQPKNEAPARWDYYGGFSQFYRRQEDTVDGVGSFVSDNSINSDLNFTARRRSTRQDMSAQISANNRYSFDDDPASDTRLYTLYADVTERSDKYSARLGRQTHSADGVGGRFDGLLASYRLTDKMKVKVVAGYPVNLSEVERVDTSREFVGISTDIGTLANRWDFNLFAIEQHVDGITDRRAAGTEFRYFDEGQSLFGYVDYDVDYNELNQATLVGNWIFANNATLGVVADYRYAPFLTTSNALIGQQAESIEELLQTFTEEEIHELALDRSARYQAVTVSGSLPLTTDLLLAGDLTVSELGDTPASGGVEAIPGTGTEYFYAAQLIWNNLFGASDVTIFGLRFSDMSTGDSSRASFSSRFTTGKWRINPRFLVEWQTRDNGVERTVYRPELKSEYQISRDFRLEFDAGYENASTLDAIQDTEQSGYYVYAGYVFNF